MGQPRDRAIFPKLQQPKDGQRTTYDLIEPSELEFPQGWQWDPENELVINDKTGKDKKSYKWYNRKSFKDKMRRIPGISVANSCSSYGYRHIHVHTSGS